MQGPPGVFTIIIVLVLIGAAVTLGLRFARSRGKLTSRTASQIGIGVVALVAVLLWVVPGLLPLLD
jgi:hypothetical protein